MPSARFKATVAVLGALAGFRGGKLARLRRPLYRTGSQDNRTTEMDGYLAVVKNPNGALLLERPLNEVASHLL